jgi:hypothetical protein
VLSVAALVAVSAAFVGAPSALAHGSQSATQGRAAAARARGHVYYVKVGGNNNHAGTRAHPFATIQRGLNRAHAGDTVVVLRGRYASASFVRGGTVGAPIVLRAARHVVLRGDGSGSGIRVSRVKHVVVAGFHISNFAAGIGLDEARAVVVRRNVLTSNEDSGIEISFSHHVRVTHNQLRDPARDSSGAFQDYGVNFYYSSHVHVDHNLFFGRHNQSLSFKRRTTYGTAVANTFEGCLLTCLYVGQNDDDSEGDQTSVHILVRRNRFRAIRSKQTGIFYKARTPIAVRNARFAVIKDNIFDPSCEQRIDHVSSRQRSGVRPGRNRFRHNVVRNWG